MTSHRRIPITDTGEILNKEDSSYDTYDDFKKKLQEYTATEESIISDLTNLVKKNLAREAFDQLVINFRGKDSLIRKGMAGLDTKMKKLKAEISDDSQGPVKNYATEVKRLEVSKLEMFKWLLKEELKNEEFHKQEALKKFMAECVSNDVVVETPDD